jgi:undecaprenyl-diphosphatase
VIAMVGLSRVYLGAHWLTDVLAGFAVGAAWLWGLLAFARASAGPRAAAAERVGGG